MLKVIKQELTFLSSFDAVNNRHVVQLHHTISSSATWEQKTITFPADTSGALGSGSGGGIDFNWWLAAGSPFGTSGSLATTWTGNSDTQSSGWYNGECRRLQAIGKLQVVQIEVGTVATDFEL